MITFVGAGPGAADLITVRGARRLGEADTVVWASSLVPEALLDYARPGAEIFDSSGMTLEDVLAVYDQRPDAAIVRLHSGDPSVYGAVYEQIAWCVENDRDFEILPGVSSLGAAAAALGVELTVPGLAQSVVVTRMPGRTSASMPDSETVEAFASHGTTMAVFLSAARPHALRAALLAGGSGYDPSTPAAVVVRATWPDERIVRTTVGDLATTMEEIGATLTALVLVGPAIGTARLGGSAGTGAVDATAPIGGRSHLYSPDYAHRFRKRSVAGTTTGRPVARRRGESSR